MNQKEVILHTKATALNAIRKLYHPKAKPMTGWVHEDDTYADMRDREVRNIILQLEEDLKMLKEKKI